MGGPRTAKRLRTLAVHAAATIVACAVAGENAADAGKPFVPLSTPAYWSRMGGAVLYAEVIGVRHGSHIEDNRIELRPIAALTGDFDQALHSNFLAMAPIGGATGAVRAPPADGAKVIVLVDRPADAAARADGKRLYSESTLFRIPDVSVACFPDSAEPAAPGHKPPLFTIRGFDDPRVAETMDRLRTIRGEHRSEAEKLPPGSRIDYDPVVEKQPTAWRASAVVYADIIGYEATGTARVRPIATLTGNLDAAYVSDIDAEIHFGDKSAIRERPHVGVKALVLLKRDEAGKYSIPDTPVDYFPADDHGNHPAYFEVLGFDNEDVDKVIENVRSLRAKDREAAQKKDSAEKKVPEPVPAKKSP